MSTTARTPRSVPVQSNHRDRAQALIFSDPRPRHRICTLFGVMGIGTIANTNPSAWGLPHHGARVQPERVVVPIPKPFDTPPGVVPYHRYLQAQNLRASSTSNRELTPPTPAPAPAQSDPRACDCVDLSERATNAPGLLPKLGEVLPVETTISTQVIVQSVRQQIVPATGRLLDLFA